MTFPTALAAPVDAGIMFWAAPRPSLHFCEVEEEMNNTQHTQTNLSTWTIHCLLRGSVRVNRSLMEVEKNAMISYR